MKLLREAVRLFAIVTGVHVVATIMVNLAAAGWYIGSFGHQAMQGYDVQLPLTLTLITHLGQALMLPLIPLIYGWSPASNFPTGLAIILNSSCIGLLAAFACTYVGHRPGVRRRYMFR